MGNPSSYYVRPMTREDLDDVTEIDREAFPTQWPPAEYSYEFKNDMAHYLVACDPGVQAERRPRARPQGRLGPWLNRLFGRPGPPPPAVPEVSHYIVGFAGFWVMAREAHVTSIAVREEYRRRGVGELLIIAVIDLSLELQADVVTLEVRVSNTAAQNLYTKYGFRCVGERRKYYLDRTPSGDTREDAFVMTTGPISSEQFRRHFGRLKEARTVK